MVAFPPAPQPHSTSGNVYADHTHRDTRYRVRVCKSLNLPGRFLSRHDAQRFLAAWLRDFYAHHVVGRFDIDRAVWAVTRASRRNYRYVRKVPVTGRYVGVVYVLGEPHLVTSDVSNPDLHPKRWGTRGERSWATRAAANAAIDAWLERFRASFGLYRRYAGLWLWR
jgi:hypothetical protein